MRIIQDDFYPLTVAEFRGLLTTERPQNCPIDYAPIANNASYSGDGKVGSREGTSTLLNLGSGITDILHSEFLYFNDGRYFLILAQDNKLYLSTEASPTATLLYSPTGSPTMFKLCVYGNLVFIFFSVAGTSTFGCCQPVVWAPLELPTVQVDVMTILPEQNILTKSIATLTSDTVNPDDGDTVTVNVPFFAHFQDVSFVYTFKTTLTPTAGEVLIGATAADSLANLKAAINLDPSGLGSLYADGTTDPYVLFEATTLTATELTIQARQSGASQDGIETTVSSSHLSWGGSTFAGGGGFDGADGAAGDCNGGYHAVRVIFHTRSGFVSAPSDARVNLIRGPGAKLPMSGIPLYTGDSDHVAAECDARILIMTEAFGDDTDLASMLDRQNWINALNGTYFTAIEIGDNATTDETIDIADEQLREETNWTNAFTYMSPLPDLSIGAIYKERLIACGDEDFPSLAYVSELGFPQNFRADVGFRDIKKEDGVTLVYPFEMDDTLYFVKGLGIYAVQDNGSTPDTWQLMQRSDQVGTGSLCGVSESSDEDFVVILDFRGMYYFNGSPPEKVSKTIQTTTGPSASWADINKAKISWAEIHIDTVKRRVHCLVPTGAATRPDKDFVADYQDGWGDKAKWAVWFPQTRAWRSMMMDTGGYRVLVCLDSQNVQKFDESVIADNGIAIDYQHRMGIAQPQNIGMGLFGGVYLSATGSGNLGLKVYGPTGTLIKTPAVLALTAAPEKDLFRGWNLKKERVFVEFFHNAVGASSAIDRATVLCKEDGIRAH